jgi:hypothetical protein
MFRQYLPMKNKISCNYYCQVATQKASNDFFFRPLLYKHIFGIRLDSKKNIYIFLKLIYYSFH